MRKRESCAPPEGLRYEPGPSLAPSGVAHRRSATEQAGCWPDYRTLSIDPESDLLFRMHQAGLTTQCVPPLTVIKSPASGRKDAYKKRSSHEQRQWTERILGEQNLETVELGKLLAAAEEQPLPPREQPPPGLISVVF